MSTPSTPGATPPTEVQWAFGPARDRQERYRSGLAMVVPHRRQAILLDGREIGYVELHLHRALGPDGVPDVSVGVTCRLYRDGAAA